MSQEISKTMHSHEVNSFVSTPRNEQESGNRLRETMENFESRSEVNQIAKKSEIASFLDPVASGQSYQAHIKTWIMVLEVILLHAENILILEMIHDPKFLQQYLEEQTSDQLFKFELLSFSTCTELRLRSLLQADPKLNPGS